MASENENPSVLPIDPQAPPEPFQVLALEDRLASPLDRLAAMVADFVLISPVAAFIMSPFRRLATEAMLQGHDDAWMIATATAVGLSILFFILYQTFFLVKWRATPGKRLLGLTVETLWAPEGTPIRAHAAFMRACALCVEALLLGLPWIGIIGNDRRRPLHDRVADTIVLSRKPTTVGAPGLSEKSLASGLVAAFFASLLIAVTFKVGQFRFLGLPLAASNGGGESAGPSSLCEDVDRAESNWTPPIGEKKPSRIAIAIALFQAEAIDEACLKTEADATLWSGSEGRDLGYLARGLAETSDEKVAQDYFAKACDTKKQTDACRAVALLNDGALPEDPLEAKAAKVVRDSELLALTSSIQPQTQPFLKILAIRELISHKNERRALALIEAMAPASRDLSFFMASERTKALWAIGEKQEARATLKAALPAFDGDQRVAMSRWFCYAETSENGCSPTARSACDLLAASVEKDNVLLGDPAVTTAYLRGETCAERLTEERLADLKSDAPDTNSQAYIEALTLLAHGNETKGVELLKTISSKDESPYAIEADLKLVTLAKSTKDLTPIRETWSDTDSSVEGWVTLGRALMERYNEFKAWDQTVELGFKIGENDAHDLSTVRPLIIAAYRSGQTQMAAGYWDTYFNKQVPSAEPEADVLRAPASADRFEDVVREIRDDLISTQKIGAAASRGPASRLIPSTLPPKKVFTREASRRQ